MPGDALVPQLAAGADPRGTFASLAISSCDRCCRCSSISPSSNGLIVVLIITFASLAISSYDRCCRQFDIATIESPPSLLLPAGVVRQRPEHGPQDRGGVQSRRAWGGRVAGGQHRLDQPKPGQTTAKSPPYPTPALRRSLPTLRHVWPIVILMDRVTSMRIPVSVSCP